MTKTAIYFGRVVELYKPIREPYGDKEMKVYVINPQTNRVNLIRFGERNTSLKSHIPARQKSYCARSSGIKSNKPEKLQPNYWSRKRWKC